MNPPGGVLFDLDGVIYEGRNPIPGAKEALNKFYKAGVPCRFITNTTRMTKARLINFLIKMGFSVAPESVFTAPHAAVEYCKLRGYRKILLIVPDPEMRQEFSSFQLVNKNPEAIVLGDMGRLFNFKLLNRLFNYAINGSQIVAMHKNRYWRSSRGLTVDLGAFIAALEYSSGKSAAIMGKPDPNIFSLAARPWNVPHNSIFMIGDDVDVDVGGAKSAGMKSVLVRTGKFREDALSNSELKPDFIIDSVSDLPGLFELG